MLHGQTWVKSFRIGFGSAFSLVVHGIAPGKVTLAHDTPLRREDTCRKELGTGQLCCVHIVQSTGAALR